MSCWNGFWFFVSCHSVMAFPSFTIRWAGAEMLYFHFPRVGNSRWPGDAFSSVLLHEQFRTWSITSSECSSSWRSVRRDGSHLNFFSIPDTCPCTRHLPPAPLPSTNTHAPMYTCAHTYRQVPTEGCNKFRYFWMLWMNPCFPLYLIPFFRNVFLISKYIKGG